MEPRRRALERGKGQAGGLARDHACGAEIGIISSVSCAVPVPHAGGGRMPSAQSAGVMFVGVRDAREACRDVVPRGTLCAAHTCSSGGRARARGEAPRAPRARPT